jgi:hypothetical protein
MAFLKEAEEAVRVYREADWVSFAGKTSSSPNEVYYHPVVSGSTWDLIEGSEQVNGFTRSILIEDVLRDANGQISENGTLDPSTKKVTLEVSWGSLSSDSIFTSYHLTRWKNLAFSESDQVEPSAGGFADWCQPNISITNVDLDRQGHPTTLSAEETPGGIDGNRILAGTGANSSGPAFSNIKIIGNEPPAANNLGDYNGIPQIKANGLSGDSEYAFLATDNKGVVILDIRTTPFQQIGEFDPKNMKKVNDVFVVGNTGYAVSEDKFYIFSISSDRTSTSQIGEIALTNGTKVVVDSSNQYAYIPNPDSSGELKIIDVHTNPGSLTNGDIVNLNTDSGIGKGVFINASATRAYLVTAASATQPEFFIVNIENKSNPAVVTGGSYDTNGMNPEGVVVVSGNRAIVVGTEGNEYQVFIVDGDEIALCPNHAENNDFLNIDSGVFAISSILQTDNHAYSYIATGDSNAEIRIVEGGPGGGSGEGTGVFESETIPIPDPGHDVVFNSFTATLDPNLSYKISIKQGISGSCGGVSFGDSDFVDFVPGPLPLGSLGGGYINPGQCLRYRVVNSGTSTVSFDINFNYSP